MAELVFRYQLRRSFAVHLFVGIVTMTSSLWRILFVQLPYKHIGCAARTSYYNWYLRCKISRYDVCISYSRYWYICSFRLRVFRGRRTFLFTIEVRVRIGECRMSILKFEDKLCEKLQFVFLLFKLGDDLNKNVDVGQFVKFDLLKFIVVFDMSKYRLDFQIIGNYAKKFA